MAKWAAAVAAVVVYNRQRHHPLLTGQAPSIRTVKWREDQEANRLLRPLPKCSVVTTVFSVLVALLPVVSCSRRHLHCIITSISSSSSSSTTTIISTTCTTTTVSVSRCRRRLSYSSLHLPTLVKWISTCGISTLTPRPSVLRRRTVRLATALVVPWVRQPSRPVGDRQTHPQRQVRHSLPPFFEVSVIPWHHKSLEERGEKKKPSLTTKHKIWARRIKVEKYGGENVETTIFFILLKKHVDFWGVFFSCL